MESLKGLKRTHYCGDLRLDDQGKEVVLMGWVNKTRDLGALSFVDLRDKTGITQLVFNKEDRESLYQKSKEVHQEYVLAARGIVRERSAKNPDLATGDIEVECSELRILDVAKTPPIYIKDDDNASEEIRLKYRYLDLRKPRMQDMLIKRAEITRLFREFLHDQNFVEVETPFLGKPTPEGARDYLVPSRVNPGYFYALPQSPQLLKQLLMIAGTDRYYQVARCFRDEDLRANRQPEFTQVDIEMSFVDMDDVMAMNEELLAYLFKEFKGIELKRPFPKMSYDEAMAKYGSDKPDLRYGYEIHDLSGIGQTTEFDLLNLSPESEDVVLGINFNGLAEKYTRKKLDKLASYAKGIGASGLLWLKKDKGEISSSFNKFLTEDLVAYLEEEMGLEDGDLAVLMVGNRSKTQEYLGMVRVHMAGENLTFDPDDFALTWIVDFPMFEYSEEESRYVAMHHPFTHPVEEDIPLLENEPEKVRAKAYDIVINGDECGGGSIRINNADLQNKIFNLLQLSQEDIENRFGFFTEALQYGTPPHGGIAYGLDRLVMTLIGRDSIKDVIAFPKTQTASDLMTQAPTSVTKDQLDELHLRVQLDQ